MDVRDVLVGGGEVVVGGEEISWNEDVEGCRFMGAWGGDGGRLQERKGLVGVFRSRERYGKREKSWG
jgi:hypothetical protein